MTGTLREGAQVTCSAPSLGSATPRYVWVLVEGSELSLLPGSTASITLPAGTAGAAVFCGRRYESGGGFAYLQSPDAGPIAAAATGGGPASPLPALPSFPAPAAQPERLSDIGFGGFPGRRTSLRRVLRRGLRGRISCNADCGFRAELVLPRRSARKARIRGRVPVVSRVRASDAAGGSGRSIRFRFSRRTAAKLRRLTRGTAVEVRVTATDTSGTRRVEKKKLRLKR